MHGQLDTREKDKAVETTLTNVDNDNDFALQLRAVEKFSIQNLRPNQAFKTFQPSSMPKEKSSFLLG